MQIIETNQKALEINLDASIYGTFAEIGAGQEVARHFFRAGAAAGTIAKTMSAFDKKFSDEIYGAEPHGRYVCQSRLHKMLGHEYDLMKERLRNERPSTCFFAFADTISAINFHKTNVGHGWIGLRFQLDPLQDEPNDVILHVKMLDNDTGLQQKAVGILGVNLLYASYRYHNDIDKYIQSLTDGLRDRIQIDMLQITGSSFAGLDNRLVSLKLVKYGLTNVAMFDKNGANVHPSEVLHKHNLLIVRGSYRPVTYVNTDMLASASKQFNATVADTSKITRFAEITLDNLKEDGEIDEADFLDRAKLLCAINQPVLITNCEQHHKLVQYFADYKIQKIGLVVGARPLLHLINTTFELNENGSLLTAFGDLFNSNVKMYVYPAQQEGTADLMTCKNLPIPEGIKFLYRYLLEAKHIEDLDTYDVNTLNIYSREVLKMLRSDEEGWENMLPKEVAEIIKTDCLFNFPCQRLEFDY